MCLVSTWCASLGASVGTVAQPFLEKITMARFLLGKICAFRLTGFAGGHAICAILATDDLFFGQTQHAICAGFRRATVPRKRNNGAFFVA